MLLVGYLVSVEKIKLLRIKKYDKTSKKYNNDSSVWVYAFCTYSGDMKSDHSKSGLFEDQISNGPVFKESVYSLGCSCSTNHLKTGLLVGLPGLISHSKSRPFANQPDFNHSKSG